MGLQEEITRISNDKFVHAHGNTEHQLHHQQHLKELVKINVSSQPILQTLSGHEKSLCCALISSSLGVIEDVQYFRAHEFIVRFLSICLILGICT